MSKAITLTSCATQMHANPIHIDTTSNQSILFLFVVFVYREKFISCCACELHAAILAIHSKRRIPNWMWRWGCWVHEDLCGTNNGYGVCVCAREWEKIDRFIANTKWTSSNLKNSTFSSATHDASTVADTTIQTWKFRLFAMNEYMQRHKWVDRTRLSSRALCSLFPLCHKHNLPFRIYFGNKVTVLALDVMQYVRQKLQAQNGCAEIEGDTFDRISGRHCRLQRLPFCT